MLFCILVFIFVILNIVCDFNYVLRTLFTVLSGKLYQRNYSLSETTSMYGICTFQDCTIDFNDTRIAIILRELDFARYHFYDRTGIYQRSQDLKIKSLQGCTFTVQLDQIPLFRPYKINTKLVFWDDRSLFLEHEVVTLSDGKIRCLLLSRQHAIGEEGDSTEALLAGLPGSDRRPECPEYISRWLESMEITSKKLNRKKYDQ